MPFTYKRRSIVAILSYKMKILHKISIGLSSIYTVCLRTASSPHFNSIRIFMSVAINIIFFCGFDIRYQFLGKQQIFICRRTKKSIKKTYFYFIYIRQDWIRIQYYISSECEMNRFRFHIQIYCNRMEFSLVLVLVLKIMYKNQGSLMDTVKLIVNQEWKEDMAWTNARENYKLKVECRSILIPKLVCCVRCFQHSMF